MAFFVKEDEMFCECLYFNHTTAHKIRDKAVRESERAVGCI